MVAVGCQGFPVGRDRYWRSLSFVEAATGKAMPRPETLAGWRADRPEGAEIALQAFRLITHGPQDAGFPPAGRKLPPRRRELCGAFRESLEVHEAWMATKAAAEALGARIVVFDTPSSFQPHPDRLRDLYRFFKAVPRGRYALVWAPRGPEWCGTAERVAADLDLVLARDPLREAPAPRGAFRYLRPGLGRAGFLDVDKMSTIASSLDDRPAYVVLSHLAAFRDAERLKERLAAPARRPR